MLISLYHIYVQIIEASVDQFFDIQADYPTLQAHIDLNDLTRLRYVVILQNTQGELRRLRLTQWSSPGVDRFHNMDKEDSAAIGGPNSPWSGILMASVQMGIPDELEETFGRESSPSSR